MTEASVEKAVARLIRHFGIAAGHDRNQRVMIARLYAELTRGSIPRP